MENTKPGPSKRGLTAAQARRRRQRAGPKIRSTGKAADHRPSEPTVKNALYPASNDQPTVEMVTPVMALPRRPTFACAQKQMFSPLLETEKAKGLAKAKHTREIEAKQQHQCVLNEDCRDSQIKTG